MERKEMKCFGAIICLILSPQLVQADALDNAGKILGPLFLVLINIPTILAFLILRFNMRKLGKALSINFFIWVLYMVPFAQNFIVWQQNDFTTQNYFVDSAFGLLIWLPITVVFIITGLLYFNKKS